MLLSSPQEIPLNKYGLWNEISVFLFTFSFNFRSAVTFCVCSDETSCNNLKHKVCSFTELRHLSYVNLGRIFFFELLFYLCKIL